MRPAIHHGNDCGAQCRFSRVKQAFVCPVHGECHRDEVLTCCQQHKNEIDGLKATVSKSLDLLQRCYIVGHREGWEDGESSDECLRAVNSFLHNVDVVVPGCECSACAEDPYPCDCQELTDKTGEPHFCDACRSYLVNHCPDEDRDN